MSPQTKIEAYALASSLGKPKVEQPIVANVAPSEYQLLALQMTGENNGEAIIRLDGFRVTARFEVEAFEDSYGVPGSEFTAVDVTNLDEVTVSDALGNPYNDFTNHIDHQNFNALIKGYIEKHRLNGMLRHSKQMKNSFSRNKMHCWNKTTNRH